MGRGHQSAKRAAGGDSKRKKEGPSVHAVMLRLRRAVKKAKQFEARKIQRRLKEAEEARQPGLREQLAMAKAADVAELAAAAQAKLGLSTPAGDGPQWNAGTQAAVYGRILGAKCVRDVIESVHTRTEAAVAETEEEDGNARDSGSADAGEASRSDGADPGSGEPETSEIDQEAEAALAKLLASASSRREVSSDDDDVAIHAADLDDMSGLSSSDEGDDWEGPRRHGDEPSASQWEPGEKHGSKLSKAKKAQAGAAKVSKPPQKKKKNRMGQRERQRLAALEHGRPPPPVVSRASKPDNAASKKGPTLEGLHPSWAAKKKEAAIKIPALDVATAPSSKIVFEDDD